MTDFAKHLDQPDGEPFYCALYFKRAEFDRTLGKTYIASDRATLAADAIIDAAQERGDEFIGAVIAFVSDAAVSLEAADIDDLNERGEVPGLASEVEVYAYRQDDAFFEFMYRLTPTCEEDEDEYKNNPEAYLPLSDGAVRDDADERLKDIVQLVAEWNILPLRNGWMPQRDGGAPDYRKTMWLLQEDDSDQAQVQVRYSYGERPHVEIEGDEAIHAYLLDLMNAIAGAFNSSEYAAKLQGRLSICRIV